MGGVTADGPLRCAAYIKSGDRSSRADLVQTDQIG